MHECDVLRQGSLECKQKRISCVLREQHTLILCWARKSYRLNVDTSFGSVNMTSLEVDFSDIYLIVAMNC